MKIVEQLNELKDIKKDLRQTANERLYKSNYILESTGLCQYPNYIKPVISAHNIHDKIIGKFSDNTIISDLSELIFQNPAILSNEMDGWTASASHYTNNEQPYKGFNKDLSGENCWWTGNSASFPCWLSLSFNDLYKVHSVEIMNEVASPANFRNALIQFKTSEDAEWETLYEIIDRPNTASYNEVYPIVSNSVYKEFRVLFTAAWSSTVSIQNINLNLSLGGL